MKRLLALLMAALVLLSLPVASARADGDDPAAEPPAAQSAAPETTPDPTEVPAPEPTESPAPAPEETPVPEPTEAPAPAPEETLAPEPTESPAPDPTEPAETPAPGEDPVPTDEPVGGDEPGTEPASGDEPPAEKPHVQPQWAKSLEYWERKRQSIALTGDIREDVLTIARSQLGYSADPTCYEEDEDGRHYYTRYGAWDGATFNNWCDSFVSFCIFYAGNTAYPGESSCRRHMFALKEAGYWREWNAYVPQKGDIVFFSAPAQYPLPVHVGIVEEVLWGENGEPNRLATIEGNQRNPQGETACVRRMVRLLDDVIGYGTYTVGTVYPAGLSYRTDGYQTIEPDSPYFVEYPTKKALRFLGLENTPYYAYWFPDEPAVQPEPPAEKLLPEPKPEPPAEKKPLPEPKPQRPAKRKSAFVLSDAT